MLGTVEQAIQQYEVLVQERIDSGMTIKDFCKLKGFTRSHYCHIVSSIHTLDPDFDTGGNHMIHRPASDGTFVEVFSKGQVSAGSTAIVAGRQKMARSQESVAEIRFGDVTVTLFHNADAQFMGQLLEALQNA